MRKAYVVRMIADFAAQKRVAVPTVWPTKVTKFHASKVLKLAPRRDIGAEA